MKSYNPYTGKPNSNNSLEGFVISHTNSSFNNDSILKGYVDPSMLKHSTAKNHNSSSSHVNTHGSSWQNSQTFISLLGEKELEIKSYEEKYKTLREDQKNEFVNLIKQTTLDSLKTQLKNNYFELDMLTSFKASIERLESVIDSWTTGVIQQPKQPSLNYLKLDQYTITQPSAKEFVEKYNNSIDFIEKQRESFNQLPQNEKKELVEQVKTKIVYSLEQQLRTGMYSPNARDEYEQAIKKLISIFNDLTLPLIVNVQPNQNNQIQNNFPLLEEEDLEMIEQLKAQLEKLELEKEQIKLEKEQKDNTIKQQANDLITKDNIIDARNTTIEQQANDLIAKDNIIGERNNTILELQNENHDLTKRLAGSEEKNDVLQNKLDISESKVIPLQEKVADLNHYNKILEADKKSLQEDKIDLRKDKEMLVEDKKMQQEEKKLLLVDKKHFQDVNLEQALKITELIQPRCDFPEHEWVKIDVPFSGKDSNIIQNDLD